MEQLNSTIDVLRELDYAKQELAKIRVHKGSVLEEKIQAENKLDAVSLKNTAQLSLVDALKKEIEKINEEKRLVEMSTVKCRKECEEIQDLKKDEAEEYLGKTEEVIKNVDYINKLESKLSATNLEVEKIRIELGLAKKNEELVLIKKKGFEFMEAMDLVRIELKNIKENIVLLKKAEEKSALAMKKSSSKLLRAEMKLEETLRAEQRAESLATDMSLVLQQLKKDAKNSIDEAKLIQQECSRIKDFISQIENRRNFNQRKLDLAMRELEEIKSSEAKAITHLNKTNANSIQLQNRVKKYHDGSRITISNSEYNRLKEREAKANEDAGEKVGSSGRVSMMSLIAKEDEIEVEKVKNVRGSKASPKRTVRTSPRRGKYVKGSSPLYQNMHTSPVFVVRKRREVMPSLAKFFTRKRIEKGL